MPAIFRTIRRSLQKGRQAVAGVLLAPVYVGRSPARVPPGSLVLFPLDSTFLACGLAGMVALKKKTDADTALNLTELAARVETIADQGLAHCRAGGKAWAAGEYLSYARSVQTLFETVQGLKQDAPLFALYADVQARNHLADIARRIQQVVDRESILLAEHMGRMAVEDVDIVSRAVDVLKDTAWCLARDIDDNIGKIQALSEGAGNHLPAGALGLYRQINSVLNSIDCLEVRGRDSAGISLLMGMDRKRFEAFTKGLARKGLGEDFKARSAISPLLDSGISVSETGGQGEEVSLALTYKVAAEIGSLGDNVRYLRSRIQQDPVLALAAGIETRYVTVLSHTRWASVGAITEANCHPVDNRSNGGPAAGIIHVCLNGDIDNFQTLRADFERSGGSIGKEITTDTKIIPLLVSRYLAAGHPVAEAFRLAVNDFDGSHAICMHTDAAPGRLFLAQKGSGQAIFIGIGPDHYMATSEIYGFIEVTASYLKMDGEKTVTGVDGPTQGQIFILDQRSAGGLDGLQGVYYDGTPIRLTADDILHTELTSRDIDRQGHAHYFFKEISESPGSVEQTLANRWKAPDGEGALPVITLGEETVPVSLRLALIEGEIRRIFFVGQGTAGIAAQACADILVHYMADPALQINALKASELSGFRLGEADGESMADTLVVAISQSGTTTDTNRTVDMVRERGAHTLAIVNRRDSDITFKVDGVMYTSSGRDIEMSVASTKAFYSQIIAGALVGLFLTGLKGRRSPAFIAEEVQRLLQIPSHMRTILAMTDRIAESARRLAPTKTYWAAVGSGPNKASADEIRIKLSELCYKTISSDFVEDKKHIDLSSEPLIIVCAAGTGGTVIGDIVKDTAIFQAHKATPVVIADQGEDRFTPFAADVFHVPPVSPHLAPIVNTLVGHVWGYYAALAINECSRFLFRFRRKLQQTIDRHAAEGGDVYELVLEKSFRETIARFYRTFRARKVRGRFPAAIGLEAATDLTLLLKYLSGRLPASDFELDFGIKGTGLNMLNTLFNRLGTAINAMSRPVDAIKHQAKTVTVGTSRISEKVEGLLFDTLTAFGFTPAQLINRNILVLKNLQEVIAEIRGSILYRIDKLNLLGELTEETTIEVLEKAGSLAPLPSRVETDTRLKGTKQIIVRQGNVYIGKGRKDSRSIVIIPLISRSTARPNTIENLLLLHIGFKASIPLDLRKRALGGKFQHIQNIAQENNVVWEDRLLDQVPVDELFGRSAEKIGEFIADRLNGNGSPSS
jgi:glutamine---fructose-6-phosphate transaminase (isomerizing)